MKTNMIRSGIAPVLALIVWLFLPQSAHCFYNATTGRWLSRDPIGEQAGGNLTTFVRNSPVSAIDGLGLADCCCCCVDDLRLADHSRLRIDAFPPSITVGHHFTVAGQFSHVLKGAGTIGHHTKCRYFWWEKTDRPDNTISPPLPPNQWVDMMSWGALTSPGTLPWKQYADMGYKCPLTFPFKLWDNPRIQAGPSATPDFTSSSLDIEITAASSLGCPCQYKSITVKVFIRKQWLPGPPIAPLWPADGSDFASERVTQ